MTRDNLTHDTPSPWAPDPCSCPGCHRVRLLDDLDDEQLEAHDARADELCAHEPRPVLTLRSHEPITRAQADALRAAWLESGRHESVDIMWRRVPAPLHVRARAAAVRRVAELLDVPIEVLA